MAETNGFLELLLRSLLDAQSEARLEQRSQHAQIMGRIAEAETRIQVSINSSAKAQDPIGEPWKLVDRIFSLGPAIWQGALWVWHVILWTTPWVLGGWGVVEGLLSKWPWLGGFHP